jgi:hypothetical protein
MFGTVSRIESDGIVFAKRADAHGGELPLDEHSAERLGDLRVGQRLEFTIRHVRAVGRDCAVEVDFLEIARALPARVS